MFMYKREILHEAESVREAVPGETRRRHHYVIYDSSGERYADCPLGWSERRVAQKVDRLNADQRTPPLLRTLANDADDEANSCID